MTLVRNINEAHEELKVVKKFSSASLKVEKKSEIQF